MDRKIPPERDEPESVRGERPIPDLLRRVLEAGAERLGESREVRQRLADLKLPKEALLGLLQQLDEGKSGLYRALASELRDFLEQTNLSDELVKALTKLTFEIKTEVRVKASDTPTRSGAKIRATPSVETQVRIRKNEADGNADPPESEETNK